MTPYPSALANRLRTTRRKRGLSRKRLAGLLGHKTTSQLCRWEQGTQVPTLAHALLLSYHLQMPIELLFQGLRNALIESRQRREEHMIEPRGAAAGRQEDLIIGSSTGPERRPRDRRIDTQFVL
jgi:transcriptional regulator with XRE-family HTH domain